MKDNQPCCEALLPCPFCGGQSQVIKANAETFAVTCNGNGSCPAQGIIDKPRFKTALLAATSWATRTPPISCEAAVEKDEWGLLGIMRNIIANHNEANNCDKAYAILKALRPWLRTPQGQHRYINQRTAADNYDPNNVDRFLATACVHGDMCDALAQNHFMAIDSTQDEPGYCHTYKQKILPKPKAALAALGINQPIIRS